MNAREPIAAAGKGLPIGRKQVAAGEGQDAERGEGEHPFHDGRERVTGDEILVQHEVECVTQLREQDQQVARDGVPSGTVRISAAEDQQQGSRGSGGDAEYLFRGDRFLEENCGENHRPQRHARGDDRGVYGRSHAHAQDEAALVEDHAQQRCTEEFGQVFRRYVFGLSEE